MGHPKSKEIHYNFPTPTWFPTFSTMLILNLKVRTEPRKFEKY